MRSQYHDFPRRSDDTMHFAKGSDDLSLRHVLDDAEVVSAVERAIAKWEGKDIAVAESRTGSVRTIAAQRCHREIDTDDRHRLRDSRIDFAAAATGVQKTRTRRKMARNHARQLRANDATPIHRRDAIVCAARTIPIFVPAAHRRKIRATMRIALSTISFTDIFEVPYVRAGSTIAISVIAQPCR